ncbi:conserved membrane hypothetical protein [Bradyrhizobium sp. ORS 375]|uniref:cytochrome c oxidase assembly protein n=1 Tax=Bradyrhizobium sp. (strain ORS 375) TaxID=566679 RepID=UPI0002407AEB|nr:cytochrome c oxidase assembly protein [Bradyrhizobium sp. ORS 375]CCD95741.1 conserved membrane hypothetical protein [Bradyrhizobium sp. ORS 375]
MQLSLVRPLLPLVLCTLTGPAAAHGAGAATGSAETVFGQGGSLEASTVVPLAMATGWYALGLQRAIRERRTELVSTGRTIAFVAGMLVLVLALESPLDRLSEDLFSAHMVQHLLLMLAAPPLLVTSDCLGIFLRAFPAPGRKCLVRLWRGARLHRATDILMHPLPVFILFNGSFVFWHAPGPYQWALQNNGLHILEHLSFFLSALMFWSVVLPAAGHRRRLAHGPALLMIVATAVLSGLPGALMIFAPRPLYPGHADGVMKWGLSPMQDQELAGLIMWIPAGSAYVLAAALVFLGWLDEAEARASRDQRRAAASLQHVRPG